MAELAAIASIIGVPDFMLRGIKSAYDVVEGLQQAPDQVKRIATELKALQNILRSIDTEGEAGPIVKKINEEMKLATMLENCANVCRDLETKLEKWMLNPDEPSLLNRARIQAHRGAIREWRNVIRDTKDSWTLAEVITTRRLHVLSLRLQNRLTDEHAEDLHQEVTSEVRTVIQEAERSARLDQRNDEQDPEEERALTKDSRPEQDDEAEGPENASGDQPGAIYTSAFQDMVREATRKAVRLSKSVVKQNFGDLEMEDNNGYDQGLAGEVEGDVIQTFNKTKIGSGNKVRQGIYKP